MESCGWRVRWPRHMAAADGTGNPLISFAILSRKKMRLITNENEETTRLFGCFSAQEVYQCKSIHFSYLHLLRHGSVRPPWPSRLVERASSPCHLSPLAHSGPVWASPRSLALFTLTSCTLMYKNDKTSHLAPKNLPLYSLVSPSLRGLPVFCASVRMVKSFQLSEKTFPDRIPFSSHYHMTDVLERDALLPRRIIN